ncbi:MAG TPA: RdgB/HAM1 family non-canonical purine NTP pyrophosphatase [Candidatus Dormibacteraeota bacterium]|nr:RdgB/HAM1 family non-canonical purine NTP pyrophosphatase [Candidatus Dormibacteraeota bacterium]
MPDRPRLVIASGNAGKIGEFRELLAPVGFELVAFDTEVEEVGKTYAENAALKAEAAAERTGLPAIGDDSGVEVEALGGFPGLRSARLGPTQRERTAELLRRLEGVPRPWNGRFVSVIALAAPGHPTEFFEGDVRGEIVPEWRGAAGFGYDPIFEIPGTGKTFGEMPPEEKSKYSHRAAAARALLQSGALRSLTTR